MKKKFRNLTFKVFTGLTILSTSSIAFPAVDGQAIVFADSNLSAMTVPVVTAANGQKVGMIKMMIPKGTRTASQAVTIKFPKNMKLGTMQGETGPVMDFAPAAETSVTGSVYQNKLVVSSGGSFATAPWTITPAADGKSVRLIPDNHVDLNHDAMVYIVLDNMDITPLDHGNLDVTLTASPASGIPSGTVTVGKLSSGDSAALSATNTVTHNDHFSFDLTITEEQPGALNSESSVKLELPSGFSWDANTYSANGTPFPVSPNYGDTVSATAVRKSDKELEIHFTRGSSGQLSSFELKGFTFSVAKSSEVKSGDIVAKISTSGFDKNTGELTVGKYSDYGANLSGSSNVPTLLAGKKEQKLGDIIITETLKQSLIHGRRILLTLPDGAKFTGSGSFEADHGAALSMDSNTKFPMSKLSLKVGNDKAWDAATYKIKDLKVAVNPTFTGDLSVQVEGPAGIKGSVLVGKVSAPVTVTALSNPNVSIGLNGQQASDITMTENTAGAFQKNDEGKVTLALPENVTFEGKPSVQVTVGDLKIKDVSVSTDYATPRIEFDIDSVSQTPSTITVSGIKLSVDRPAAQGDIFLKIGGKDLIDTDTSDYWANHDLTAQVTIAKAIHSATSFTIGKSMYTFNGLDHRMDAPPYIKESRTYLPIRYVANSLGISDESIYWDQETQTVTIMKGKQISQFQGGKNYFITNGGVRVPMDAAAEIKGGRMMLPLHYAALAVGAEIKWNQERRMVTVANVPRG